MDQEPEQWLKETTADRFLGCQQTDDDAYVVFIDQAQLGKTECERLERQIHSLWRGDYPSYDLEINFKSRARPIAGKAPLPNPLGVEIKKRAIPGVHRIIAVSSGKGGVGKSTVSTNLAVSLAQQGAKVGLLDADLYGPSAPTMFGNADSLKVSSENKLVPALAHGVKFVSFGNLTPASTPVIWRGPLLTKGFEQLCYDVDWGELDYLVLDLPPGTGDIQLTMIEKLPVAAAVIVSTPQDIALIDVKKGLSMFRMLDVPILGVVENMAHYTCTNCGHEEHIFGSNLDQFAADHDTKVLSRIPLTVELRTASDAGQPIGEKHPAFAALAEAVCQGPETRLL